MNKYRADHLASFLRPPAVREARAAFREGRIPASQLAQAEDGAIREALEKQRQVGLDIYSDGEFRRTGFQNDFMESVEGYVPAESPPVVRIWQGPGGAPEEQGISHVVGAKLKTATPSHPVPGSFPQGPRPWPLQDDRPQSQPVSSTQFPSWRHRPPLCRPLRTPVGHRLHHQRPNSKPW